MHQTIFTGQEFYKDTIAFDACNLTCVDTSGFGFFGFEAGFDRGHTAA